MIKTIFAATLALAAQNNPNTQPTSPEQTAIDKVKRSLAYDLKDPDSAKFRNVRAGFRGEDYMVCGELNAKNSYGAYNGYKPFMVWGDNTIIPDTIDPVLNNANLRVAVSTCSSILDKGATPPVSDAASIK
jgi:hypothetical protein